LEDLILLKWLYYQKQEANEMQSVWHFYRNTKKKHQFHMEAQVTLNRQNNLSKEEQC
jgi:hypothetical protein